MRASGSPWRTSCEAPEREGAMDSLISLKDQERIPLTQRRQFFNLLEISIPSSRKAIHEMVMEMRKFFSGLEIDRDSVEDIVLLLDEAATNTAEHAHEFDPSKEVNIRITVKPSKIQLFVKGSIERELILKEEFVLFLRRLLAENLITRAKCMEFVKELLLENLLTPKEVGILEDRIFNPPPEEERSDDSLECLLDERGRGIILIKRLTRGKVKVDILGKTLTFVLTKLLQTREA